jgi:hypothetical protein
MSLNLRPFGRTAFRTGGMSEYHPATSISSPDSRLSICKSNACCRRQMSGISSGRAFSDRWLLPHFKPLSASDVAGSSTPDVLPDFLRTRGLSVTIPFMNGYTFGIHKPWVFSAGRRTTSVPPLWAPRFPIRTGQSVLTLHQRAANYRNPSPFLHPQAVCLWPRN